MLDIPTSTGALGNLDNLPGLLGIVAASLTGITSGVLLLRKYLSNDSVERAGNEGLLQIIKAQGEQIAKADARAAAAIESRDKAVAQIDELKIKLNTMSIQLDRLQAQLAQFTSSKPKE